MLDPFGSIASAQFTMGQTVAENNEQFPPFTGLLLLNRIIWVSVAVGFVFLGVVFFPMRERRAGGSKSGQLRRMCAMLGGAPVMSFLPGQVARILGWE